MIKHSFPLETEADTAALAQAMACVLQPIDCLTLCGTLGAGKTTFMRHLIHAMQPDHARTEVISPTFMLVQDYNVQLSNTENSTLYHLDAYRLEDASECEEIGLTDMLETGILCIEWPEICSEWLPKQRINLTLNLEGTQRVATIIFPSTRKQDAERVAARLHDAGT